MFKFHPFMNETDNSHKALWSAIWLGIVGSAIFNLEPLFLAAATEQFQLSNKQIGFLASSELAGIALASVTTPLWLPRFDKRHLAYIGLLLIASGNLVSIGCDSFDELLRTRFLTGVFGSGVVYVIAIVTLGNKGGSVKNFGLLIFSQMLFSGITLSLLPSVTLHFSLMHILLFLSFLGATALLVVQFIPARSKEEAANIPPKITLNGYGFLALTGMFLIAFNLGSIWSYAERIGVSSGLDIQEIGALLGLSMLPQAIGAIIPSLLGRRIGYTIPLVVALSGQIIGLFILAKAENASGYFWGISLWGSCLNLGIAYKLGLISELPNKNRLLALVPGVQAVAIASSSSFCALFILNNDFSPVIFIAAISVVLSFILFIFLSMTNVNYRLNTVN
ncbi:MAG: hypothetical protein ACC641_10480 [Acidiferrobacterales bacterium]